MKELLLKIRNYLSKEHDYYIDGRIKTYLLDYLAQKMESYAGKPSILEGYAICMRDIRGIKEEVERLK